MGALPMSESIAERALDCQIGKVESGLSEGDHH